MTCDSFLLAVDGGGSTCRVRLARLDGTPLAQSQGGSANVNSDYDAALRCLRATIDEALYDAGRVGQTPCGAYLGLAGANASPRSDEVAQDLGLPDAIVTSDREPTIEGAFAGEDGIVALFGTGSFFAGRVGGQIRHLGGWGLVLGDTGGGAWIGQHALRETLRAHDGQCRHSPLTRALLARYDNQAAQIVSFATAARPADFAALAPEILAAAAQGDPLGRALTGAAMAELRSALDVLDPDGAQPVALLGGLGARLAPFAPDDIASRLVPAKGSPLDGAMALARKAVQL